jgi:hypothetical protein
MTRFATAVRAALLGAMLISCGKAKRAEVVGATQTIPIGSTGFVVDVPAGWTMQESMAGIYEFRLADGHPGGPMIVEARDAPPGSVDEHAPRRCEGRAELQTGTLTGGWWLACKGDTSASKDKQLTFILSEVASGDLTVECAITTARPIVPLAVCKSIRKK